MSVLYADTYMGKLAAHLCDGMTLTMKEEFIAFG